MRGPMVYGLSTGLHSSTKVSMRGPMVCGLCTGRNRVQRCIALEVNLHWERMEHSTMMFLSTSLTALMKNSVLQQ